MNNKDNLREEYPAREVEFGDPTIMNWQPGEDDEEGMIYCRCPLCGSRGAIYGGNTWGTSACCYNDSRVERLVAGRLMEGDSQEEVCKLLTLVGVKFLPEYIAEIHALLNPGKYRPATCMKYREYLETVDSHLDLDFIGYFDEPITEGVTGCMLHEDGTLSVVKNGKLTMYKPAEVEIIRQAITDYRVRE